jgi:hypothetical protein
MFKLKIKPYYQFLGQRNGLWLVCMTVGLILILFADYWGRIVGFGGGDPAEIGSHTGIDTSVIGIRTFVAKGSDANLSSVDENWTAAVTL